MAAAPTQKSVRQARRDRDVIRTSIPNIDEANTFMLRRPTRIAASYISATLGNKSGYTTFNVERGDATYRALTWGIRCTAAIVDVTVNIAGVHYVQRDKLSTYLGQVRTVANGSIMQEFSMAELTTYNKFHDIAYGPVFDGFAYPGDNLYSDRAMSDAFALGTKNFRSLTLEIQQKAAFDAATMEIVVVPHVVDKPMHAYFCNTTERLSTTWTGVGLHTYLDLPVNDDLRNIWIIADGVQHVKLEIDGDIMFDMDRAQYEAYLSHHGRDTAALGGSWLLDFHAEAEPRSLSALDLPDERRRDARYKLTVTTTQDVTPVQFVLQNADLYKQIR